jgi:hypothetical protein
MPTQLHPGIQELLSHTICLAWKDYTGDIHISVPHLAQIKGAQWTTEMAIVNNPKLPTAQFHAHYCYICRGFP